MSTGFISSLTDTIANLYIEEFLSLEHLQVPGMGGGRVDAMVVSEEGVHIIDFKYGYLPVDIEDNTQLLSYAIGAIERFKLTDDQIVTMTITQPRAFHKDGIIRSWSQTVRQVLEWCEITLLVAAKGVLSENPSLKSSAAACRWCPISGNCKAQNEEFIMALGDKFEIDQELTSERKTFIIENMKSIKGFLAAVETQVRGDILGGKEAEYPKLKVIKRKGRRKLAKNSVKKLAVKYPKINFYKTNVEKTFSDVKKLLSPAELHEFIENGEDTEVIVINTEVKSNQTFTKEVLK